MAERDLSWKLDARSKSLIAVESEGGERRYRLLESTRQYVLERLDRAGERDAAAQRHCRYYSALVQRYAYWEMDSDAWIAQVRIDLENYRAAINYGLAGGHDVASAATIAGNLRWLWITKARAEGRVLVERAAMALPPDAPACVSGSIAVAEALLDSTSAQATTPAARAVRILSGGIDETSRVEVLTLQGGPLWRAGHATESVAALDEALVSARAAGKPRLIGWVLSVAAGWFGYGGDPMRARACFEEGAAILRTCNDRALSRCSK